MGKTDKSLRFKISSWSSGCGLAQYVCQLLALGNVAGERRVRWNAGKLTEELENSHVHKLDCAWPSHKA